MTRRGGFKVELGSTLYNTEALQYLVMVDGKLRLSFLLGERQRCWSVYGQPLSRTERRLFARVYQNVDTNPLSPLVPLGN